jgi:hypothetical protein
VQFKSKSKLLALSLVFAAGLPAALFAPDAPEGGQTVRPPPVPDPGTTSQLHCIDQKNEYPNRGKSVFYVQTFENKCSVI